MDALQTLTPHVKNLGGGFVVRRSLPSVPRQAVGPFLFFDHFGPLTVEPGSNHDVRPHPHIGLATVTYLFEGAILHRDSTGVVQRIEPGAINWMTAGRGIVHSERMPDDLREHAHVRHGLQLWAALPAEHEEDEPSFSHTPSADIPTLEHEGAPVRVLIGEAFGLRSPVPTVSPTLYLDLQLPVDKLVHLPALAAEQALYSVDQPFAVDGRAVAAQTLAVLPAGRPVRLRAEAGARLVLVGGEPLGHRFLWWNFVSSRRERMAQAADDWAAQRFDAVPGEIEFIPLPERRPG
jgi:redox-sensitive bicupin YhaK (pirin superfamily)